MTATPRAAGIAAALAIVALLVPSPVTLVTFTLLLAGVVVDVVYVRQRPNLDRTVPGVLARGVASELTIATDARDESSTQLRQPQPPDMKIDPPVARGQLRAALTPTRRGANALPAPAVRRIGPLGLGRRTWTAGQPAEVLVYPDVVAAHRLVEAMRRGRFRDPGLRTRGPLGLGTDFEAIRDYLPDDDVRQINWRASERVGRPMSNVYRIEQDRDIIALVDAGRLMAAPISSQLTRLDATIDAVVMVALVADELGDRCGVTVFDRSIKRRLPARRNGGRAVIQTILDTEPTLVDSDYDLAFRSIGNAKRALVLVCTDLIDDAAARSLVEAIPYIARRHAVVVATVRDPDVEAPLHTPPRAVPDVYAAAVALEVNTAKDQVVARLRHAGAQVVEAPPALLGPACVRAYLQLKARARL
ncbi:MAG TPA: DUF58 domain-containing protein [Acidimicrobiia bacterium]|nr:DUF58 domain-containing protein [Acidimicrobiia bacterium]